MLDDTHTPPDRPQHLAIWTVYDHPKDYPNNYVARLWHVGPGGAPVATPNIIICPDLEAIRKRLDALGLVCLARDSTDDPCIVETWV